MILEALLTEKNTQSEFATDLNLFSNFDDLIKGDYILNNKTFFITYELYLNDYIKSKKPYLLDIYNKKEEIDEILYNFLNSEIAFTKKVINHILENNNLGYIFWDLDKTLLSCAFSSHNGLNTFVRPSFIFIARFLNTYYPKIKSGILSNRAINNIGKIRRILNSAIGIENFFDPKLLFTNSMSNGFYFEKEELNERFNTVAKDRGFSWFKTNTDILSYISKANDYFKIVNNLGKESILIDDCVDIDFEKRGFGLAITKDMQFLYTRLGINIDNFNNNQYELMKILVASDEKIKK